MYPNYRNDKGRRSTLKKTAMAAVVLCGWIYTGSVIGENIDPYNTDAQYAWAENVGWLNFQPGQGTGVHVESNRLTGFIWAENIGWINLSCQTTGTCGTVDFGVVVDGTGNLSGFAWAENVGWINFNPVVPGSSTQYNMTIDFEGYFRGWAWGENIGWIRVDRNQAWSVRTCVVSLDDLTNFASYWLEFGNPPANLNNDRKVDIEDFEILAAWWRNFCPDGWPLK